MSDKETRPFEFSDVEDVRINIKANGKHYGMVAKKEFTNEESKLSRIAALNFVLEYHSIVGIALEDLHNT